ncbi:MAG: OprO/OprP family phosphate-selective porin [Gammaproteobacteria bacterium]|nr:OprO/OprP family phosphate-selective porin [Gammaproteobacteria bacterium]MBU1776452.1 OprO/OprP family phosphate-selective porin [Gammaproteobacteria bacterium]MBU1968291.1 OprO/OprP family phosphate-selective porin [Gammaproteobacteria bacterium]
MFKRICSSTAMAVLLSHSIQAAAADNSNADNAFNPAFSLILSGGYGNLQQDPAIPATGFAMNPAPEHEQGFNLGESEMGISANIDPQFRGAATLALDPAGGVSVENAFVQTTSLGDGLNLKFGRFFSGLGYLNEHHAHAWDFTDQPLVYAVLWENQLADDGLQLKWLAPTEMFFEIGGEVGKGRGFPGTERAKNGSGAGVLFVHVGDDIGIEHSWRAGASLHRTRRVDAESVDVPDMGGNAVINLFTGDSQTVGLDLVWKYAPDGNVRNSYVKLQAEYFRRKEDGELSYDTEGANVTDSYTITQSGFYVQGVYQFMPRWRSGLRYDRLDPGVAQVGALNAGNVIADYAYNPSRTTLMVDYSASEFSRLRLQLAHDNSRQGLADNQFFVQYIMSLGAHGAHQY